MDAKESAKNRRIIGIAALLAILVAGILLAAHAARSWNAIAQARRLKNPVPSTAEALSSGLAIYRQHCQRCHGEKGDGKGEKAAELSVAPGDFTDAAKMKRLTDGELFYQTTKGRLPMPAFAGKLSDVERWQVVDYIRTFAEPHGETYSIPCNPPQRH